MASFVIFFSPLAKKKEGGKENGFFQHERRQRGNKHSGREFEKYVQFQLKA